MIRWQGIGKRGVEESNHTQNYWQITSFWPFLPNHELLAFFERLGPMVHLSGIHVCGNIGAREQKRLASPLNFS